MALGRVKTWIAGETLTAADLNAEFNNYNNNALSLISPLTGTLDADGNEIILDADGDTSITADTDDQIDIKIAGADDFQLTANKLDVLAGSTLKVTGTETLTKGADVASATDLLVNIDGNIFDVTGTTTIATIATKGIGTVIKLHFDGVLTLTHDATNLILPGGANITTAAGDEAEFYEYAAADWRCTKYTKADGKAVISSATKEFIVRAVAVGDVFGYGTNVGDFQVTQIAVAGIVKYVFHIPHDFTSLTDAVVVVIPDTTETIQWDVTTDFGANGEAYTTNSDSITNATLAVTINVLAECDVSAALTGIAAGDYIGMEFVSDINNIRAVFLRIRYT